MADITDPEAIGFSNDCRGFAEKFRNLKAEIDSLITTWYSGINVTITNDAGDNIVDGRQAQGDSQLTGADIHSLLGQFVAYQTQLNQGGVADVISKPCVRKLETK